MQRPAYTSYTRIRRLVRTLSFHWNAAAVFSTFVYHLTCESFARNYVKAHFGVIVCCRRQFGSVPQRRMVWICLALRAGAGVRVAANGRFEADQTSVCPSVRWTGRHIYKQPTNANRRHDLIFCADLTYERHVTDRFCGADQLAPAPSVASCKRRRCSCRRTAANRPHSVNSTVRACCPAKMFR